MATTVTTRRERPTASTPALSLAFEVGAGTWTLGLTTGVAPRPRERRVTAGDVRAVREEATRAKRRCG